MLTRTARKSWLFMMFQIVGTVHQFSRHFRFLFSSSSWEGHLSMTEAKIDAEGTSGSHHPLPPTPTTYPAQHGGTVPVEFSSVWRCGISIPKIHGPEIWQAIVIIILRPKGKFFMLRVGITIKDIPKGRRVSIAFEKIYQYVVIYT